MCFPLAVIPARSMGGWLLAKHCLRRIHLLSALSYNSCYCYPSNKLIAIYQAPFVVAAAADLQGLRTHTHGAPGQLCMRSWHRRPRMRVCGSACHWRGPTRRPVYRARPRQAGACAGRPRPVLAARAADGTKPGSGCGKTPREAASTTSVFKSLHTKKQSLSMAWQLVMAYVLSSCHGTETQAPLCL